MTKRLVVPKMRLSKKTTERNLMQSKKANVSPIFDKFSENVIDLTGKEFRRLAKSHNVKVDIDKMVYASIGKTIVAHVPIVGVEKYKDIDFESGVPIQLLIVKSTIQSDVPSGSYVVKIQHSPRASLGKAFFIDSSGITVAERILRITTWEKSSALFPDVYLNPEPQYIPRVTSLHVFQTWDYATSQYIWHVDCAGWTPHRVVYY